MQSKLGSVALWVGAASFLLFGLWAVLGPRSFYETMAEWPPYNHHFIHDIGAFQLGLGAGLVAALAKLRGGASVLTGAATGALVHTAVHFLDAGDGGKPSDPFVIGAFALLLAAGLIAELKAGPR